MFTFVRLFPFTLVLAVLASAQALPLSTASLVTQAEAAERANDFAGAAVLYKQLVAIDPQGADGWWHLGSTWYTLSRFPDAADALSKAVELDRRSAPALGLLGLSEFELGRYEQAREHIQGALALGVPGQAQLEGTLRYHLALLLSHSGSGDRALNEYNWFVQRGEQQSALLIAMGMASLHNTGFPEQLPEADRELYFTAGKAAYLSAASAHDEAQQVYQDLLARYGARQFVHYSYALFLMKKDPQGAQAQLQEEVGQFPGNGSANAMLAWVLIELDNYADAWPYAERAEKESAGLPLAELVYGRSLADKGDLTGAIQHLKVAAAAEPGNVFNHIALAAAYSKARFPIEARRERARALEIAAESHGGS